MALHTTVIISLSLTFGIVLAALIGTALIYFSKPKHKTALGWLAFANICILIWTTFHLFLDLELFAPTFVETVHYWITHPFIIIASISLYQAARVLTRK
ncbi:hypothetical protein C4580_01750 [Candidatus Woesearchaeota archaeon]|nr:MAG: hypothetical protein C4580_01750 [Candidatus Woesearchaeota archaeon]